MSGPRLARCCFLAAVLLSASPALAADEAATPAAEPAPAEPAAKPADADHKLVPVAPPPKQLNKQRVLSLSFADTDNAALPAARLGYVLDSAVRLSDRYEPADAIALFDPDGAAERAEAARKANDALVFGLKDYSNLEEGLGLESFNRAMAAFQETALWEKANLQGYVKSALMRIIVKWAEDPGATRREIGNLLAIDPKVTPPADLSPPAPRELVQEIESQREQLEAAHRMSYDVAARPAARVYLDGVYRGTTPITVKNVVVGEHMLSLVAPGYEAIQRVVRLSPGDTVSETLKQTEKGKQVALLVEQARKHWDGPEEIEAEKKLAGIAEADQVLLAGVSRSSGMIETKVHRLRVSDGHSAGCHDSAPQGEASPNLMSNLGKEIETSLKADAPLCQGKACMCRTKIPPNQNAIIGTGVPAAVLIAGGVTLGVIAKVKSDAFIRLPQTQPDLKKRGSEVFMFAAASDACMGAGLIMAGVWAYITFGTSYARHAEIQTEHIEDSGTPGGEKRQKPEDDPFETRLLTPPVPAFAITALPQPGGASLAIEGTF